MTNAKSTAKAKSGPSGPAAQPPQAPVPVKAAEQTPVPEGLKVLYG